MIDTGYMISSVQQMIGAAPRKIDWNHYASIIDCEPPEWDWQNDELRLVIQNWRTIFEQGFVTVAHIVQANSMMFQFGKDNCPGAVVVWHDNRASPDLRLMRFAARGLYELKESPHLCQDEWEQKISSHLACEQERAFGWTVPVRFRGDFDLRFSTIYFQRRHIPGGKLIRSWFPVVCLPENPMLVSMVPRDFWPPDLVAHWSRPRG